MNVLYNSNWLENDIPDKSINLIIADPPYFEVKGEFDFIWKSFSDYLKDVEKWAVECKRVLADNGSLLWWGMDMKIAYSQIILDKYFNLLNCLIWEKPNALNEWETRRNFPEKAAERCLFYGTNDIQTGLEYITEKYIKPNNPFAIYLKKELNKSGVSIKELSRLFPSKTGGLTGCISNWVNGDNVITEEQYLLIRNYLNNKYLKKEYSYLKKEYEELRSQYEELRSQYEKERRPFDNQYKLNDLINSNRESNEYDHDTKKPLTLTKKLIQTTTRKGDLVLIPFGGSGTEVEACINTGRKYICYEIAEKHFNTIKEREKKTLNQPELF